MKKSITIFLIITLVNCYLGCTTKVIKTGINFTSQDNNDDLVLLSTDSTKYFFEANMYRFKNDSIDGIAQINGSEQKQRVKLARADLITGIELDKRNNNDDLILLTNDSTEYFFEGNTYRFLKDSLDGLAQINNAGKNQRVKIAYADVKKVSYEYSTISPLAIIGLVGLGIILYFVLKWESIN